MGTKRRREERGGHRLVGLACGGLLVALSSILVGSAGCTVFDGLSVPPASSGPSSSASSGSSGAGGAGNTGAGGASTSTGNGGAGVGGAGVGGAGVGGAGNGGAGAGGATGGPITFLQQNDAALVCSQAFTCPLLAASIALSIGVPVDDTNYSQCMTWLAAPVPSRPGSDIAKLILACVAASSSCDQAAGCLPVQAIDPADPACSGGSKCIDGATALDCSAHAIYHCSTSGFLPGSVCQSGGGVAACTKDSCVTPGDTLCATNTLATCTGVGLVQTPCEVAGLACSTPAGQPAACVGEGPCAAPGASSCQGGIALVCGDGVESAFDCGAIGEVCFSEIADEARCDAPATACTPTSGGINQCSANKKNIDACIGGSIVKVNCPGAMSCKGAQGNKTAYCG